MCCLTSMICFKGSFVPSTKSTASKASPARTHTSIHCFHFTLNILQSGKEEFLISVSYTHSEGTHNDPDAYTHSHTHSGAPSPLSVTQTHALSLESFCEFTQWLEENVRKECILESMKTR